MATGVEAGGMPTRSTSPNNSRSRERADCARQTRDLSQRSTIRKRNDGDARLAACLDVYGKLRIKVKPRPLPTICTKVLDVLEFLVRLAGQEPASGKSVIAQAVAIFQQHQSLAR